MWICRANSKESDEIEAWIKCIITNQLQFLAGEGDFSPSDLGATTADAVVQNGNDVPPPLTDVLGQEVEGEHATKPRQPGPSQSPPKEADHLTKLRKSFTFGLLRGPPQGVDSEDTILKEVRLYLDLPTRKSAKYEDVFLFWRDHRTHLPRLYQLFLFYASIPASSVHSE